MMTNSEIIRFLILRTIGNFLVLFALYGVGATFGPALYFEAVYRIALARGVQFTVQEPKQPAAASLGEINERSKMGIHLGAPNLGAVLTGPREQIVIPKDTDFSIVISKIGASAKIFPNIDSSNEEEFVPVLQEGVAHAKGTVFPGMKGNIYLFAHSTDNFWNVGVYNAIFYLLKDMQKGDDVVVFFETIRHNYVVEESFVLDAEDVSYLVNSQNTDGEKLILQTCWPPGTTWKRLIVVASPK